MGLEQIRLLAEAASQGMRRVYLPGYQLIKAGVMLLDLSSAATVQHELDLQDDSERDRSRLMVALDSLNTRYGKGTVNVASAGPAIAPKDWGMRQERRTPQYTTRWQDVPIARA